MRQPSRVDGGMDENARPRAVIFTAQHCSARYLLRTASEDGPWLSARSEAQRESAEEYEMLKALAKKDKARADSICAKVFRSFCDVEYDVAKFRAARRELLEELSE